MQPAKWCTDTLCLGNVINSTKKSLAGQFFFFEPWMQCYFFLKEWSFSCIMVTVTFQYNIIFQTLHLSLQEEMPVADKQQSTLTLTITHVFSDLIATRNAFLFSLQIVCFIFVFSMLAIKDCFLNQNIWRTCIFVPVNFSCGCIYEHKNLLYADFCHRSQKYNSPQMWKQNEEQ